MKVHFPILEKNVMKFFLSFIFKLLFEVWQIVFFFFFFLRHDTLSAVLYFKMFDELLDVSADPFQQPDFLLVLRNIENLSFNLHNRNDYNESIKLLTRTRLTSNRRPRSTTGSIFYSYALERNFYREDN